MPLHNYFLLRGEMRFDTQWIDSDIEDLDLNEVELFEKEYPAGLTKDWSLPRSLMMVPEDKIKNYFGEKIAMYFEFLSFYTLMLIIPALFGVPVFIVDQIFDNQTPQMQTLNSLYAGVMIVWTQFYIDMWQQREHLMATKWGELEFEEEEVERPAFRGELVRSPVDDTKVYGI